MRFAKLIPFVLLALLGGCKNQVQIGGKDPEQLYRAAVSLSPGTTELLAQKTKINILGRTESCTFPPTVLKVPVVMNGIKPNFEQIKSIAPPLVIYDTSLLGQAEVDQLRALGLKTFAVGSDTVAGFVDELYELGSMSASETLISEYVDAIETAVSTGKALLKDKPSKVAFLIPGNGGEHMICGTDSFLADIARQIGATPVGPKGRLFVTANIESLIAENPDVIITAGKPAGVYDDPRLRSMKAIKSGRIRGINEDVMLRHGSRVERLIRNMADAIGGAK